MRERALAIAKPGEAFLAMERHRVVDRRADAVGGKTLLHTIASRHPDHELIVDVHAIRRLERQRHTIEQSGGLEERAIAGGVAAPAGRPGVEVRRLDAEDGGLQSVETEVAADHAV